MAVVQVDVFDIDDPNGTPLGTIDSAEAEAIDWRIGIRGDPGEGHVLINRGHSAASLIAPDRIYKVKVPVIDSDYLHAFIQKDARYTLAHPKESGAETLDLFGPGLKALFAQARLLWQYYAPGQTARGSADHAHNLWWWINEPYGAIATRVIEEGINQPGTPLADMDVTFTRTHDSDGTPWANIAEEWQETVGTDVLSILARLEEAGDFYIEVLPDLTVNAYQSLPARDLTGSVHIQKGVNLMTTLKRTIHGRPAITHLELEDSEGNYSLEVDPGWSSGERGSIGYYKAATNDDTTLNKIGQEVIRRSRSSLQPIELEVDPLQLLAGPEGSTGGQYWINCEVLLSTGDGPQDYDEETVLITGLRFSLDKAVDDTNASSRKKSLRIVIECNVETISSVDPKAGFGGPRDPHSHAEILCPALTPGLETNSRLYFTVPATPLAASAGWTGGSSDMTTHALAFTPSGGAGGNPSWDAVNQAAASFALVQGRITLSNAGLLAAIQSGGTFRIQAIASIRHGVGIDESSHREYLEGCIRVWRPGTSSFIGTILAVGAATGSVYALTDASGTPANRSMAGTAAAVAGAVATDVLVVELGLKHTAPVTGGAGGAVKAIDSAGVDLPEDDSTLTNGNAWVEFRTVAAPTGTGNNAELVGTERQVARCDHKHHVTAERAPTVSDDDTQGYPVGTFWIYLDGDEILATYLLLDNTTDTAVWVLQATPNTTVYTDEQAQDAVGGMIADTATVDLTYTDATPELKADVIPAGIKLDDLGTPDDNTDLNASTTRHGLLRKLSNVATEYLDGTGAWSEPAGGGGISASIVDAKGDLIVATANDTVARQAVGTDGYVLTADSSLANGLKWALPSATPAVGYQPYAHPIQYDPSAAYSTAISLPAAGGSLAVGFLLTAPMRLMAARIRSTDTASVRTWGWDLYYEATSTNVLTRVAASTANESFTPVAASIRTVYAASNPVLTQPGSYWLVIQNRHATNTFGIGSTAATALGAFNAQTKTTTNPNGATLDFTAATWTKQGSSIAALLLGAVFGQATEF